MTSKKTLVLADTYRRYASWLARTLRRQIGGGATDDVVQETYLRLVQAGTEDIRNPRAWLVHAGRNIRRDQVRRSGYRIATHAVALDEAYGEAALVLAPDQESTLLLKQVILSLPPIYRDVFVLNRFVGLTYHEIAERHGITSKAVEYRMSRALALCAAALRE